MTSTELASIPAVESLNKQGRLVRMRKFPYPYRAMLAICSDLDETPDFDVYRETARFLNTTELTRMGNGVGLEVGNTIYFDMPPNQFAYWNTSDEGRGFVRDLIRSGHVDCIHSFGDLARTRADAERSLNELARHHCRLEAWIDHSVAPSNFGADIMKGSGDVPGSDVYHADLTCASGVQYVWRGRVTSVIGQNTARNLGGIFHSRHSRASLRTLTKELAKGLLGQMGNAKYAMHQPNEVLTPARLRDGQQVWEFLRANPSWGGVSCHDNATGLGEVLTESMLEELVAREGVCVLYTHLGKVPNSREPLPGLTRSALVRLQQYSEKGQILVTTTRRLLGYCRASQTLQSKIRSSSVEEATVIHLDTKGLESRDLAGLTLYVDHPDKTSVFADGRELEALRSNPPDHSGMRSVSIPWTRLEFPTS